MFVKFILEWGKRIFVKMGLNLKYSGGKKLCRRVSILEKKGLKLNNHIANLKGHPF